MEWIILVYLFWFEEFNQWTNWKFSSISQKNIHKIKITAPKWNTLFVHILHLVSFFRPTNCPSVRHMIRPSNKASVRPTNRWSIGQIVRLSHRSFVRCACKKKVTTVALVCVSRALSVVRLFCLFVAIVASALAPMDY